MSRSMVISLIGRPNVGKSSLFNRLLRRDGKAITHDMPGVTRDRHYAIAYFDEIVNDNKRDAIVIDTGGFYPESATVNKHKDNKSKEDYFFDLMSKHAEIAISESDLVLFVVDIREGLLPFDELIFKYIRQQKKKCWLLINKFDSDKQLGSEVDFYSFGLKDDQMFMVSAAHSKGLSELRESIHKELIKFEKSKQVEIDSMLQKGIAPREKVVARLAILGAPNAGKSTMLNTLVGADRALVSDIPGTTVDPIEAFFDIYFGKDIEKVNETKVSYDGSKKALIEEYEAFRKQERDVYNEIGKVFGDLNCNDEDDIESEIENESDQDIEFEFDETLANEDFKAQVQLKGELDLETVFAETIIGDVETKSDIESENDDVKESRNFDSKSYWGSVHIVDTAGIRKQKQVEGLVESLAVYHALKCVNEADIVLYMIDSTKEISHQDRRLLDIAYEKGCSIIICLNKIDLIRKKFENKRDREEWLKDLRYSIPWLDHVDLVPVSAKHNKYIGHLKKIIKKTVLVRHQSVSTGELNRLVFELVNKNPLIVKRSGGKRLKLKYASLVKQSPPTFLLFVNRSKNIPENYKRYIRNAIRNHFCISNTPIHIIFRSGVDLYS